MNMTITGHAQITKARSPMKNRTCKPYRPARYLKLGFVGSGASSAEHWASNAGDSFRAFATLAASRCTFRISSALASRRAGGDRPAPYLRLRDRGDHRRPAISGCLCSANHPLSRPVLTLLFLGYMAAAPTSHMDSPDGYDEEREVGDGAYDPIRTKPE